MAVDVLVLNTAVTDFRRADFEFADELVGKGGLAKCETKDMPDYSQAQLAEWIKAGFACAGGCGNSAPLIARAGLKVAVGVNLGAGDFGGLDAQGRFFCDTMAENGIDMSQTFIHQDLPTGTTFGHDCPGEDRGGIAYFPNANNDFDFRVFKKAVERLEPRVVYYMYSGLSDRGDANGGRDLADFIKWCREKGIVTIADSHTLTGNPQELIDSAAAVAEYKLLEPLLSELDLFFTSYDEARMIENTIGKKSRPKNLTEDEYIPGFLDFLADKSWKDNDRTRMFGVTVSNGAYEKHIRPNNNPSTPAKVKSDFMAGEVIDLVGAGDSFRAGLISYIAKNIEEFKTGKIDFTRAVQMGNLFASLYIKAPLNDRYGNIGSYDKMLEVVKRGAGYNKFADLLADLI